MVRFALTIYLFLVVLAALNSVTNCTSNTSCSRSGNSLVLIRCLTYESCYLFLWNRVEFYIPIKRVAKSKLAVSQSWLSLTKFCHQSWVLTCSIRVPVRIPCSVCCRSGLDCLSCTPLRYLEIHHCLPALGCVFGRYATVLCSPLWRLSRSLDLVYGSWISLVLKSPCPSELGHFGQK